MTLVERDVFVRIVRNVKVPPLPPGTFVAIREPIHVPHLQTVLRCSPTPASSSVVPLRVRDDCGYAILLVPGKSRLELQIDVRHVEVGWRPDPGDVGGAGGWRRAEPSTVEREYAEVTRAAGQPLGGVSGPNRFDFTDARFVEWLGPLRDEQFGCDMDFLLKLNARMSRTISISHSLKRKVAPEVVDVGYATCHGCNSVLVSACRERGMLALVQHGMKLICEGKDVKDVEIDVKNSDLGLHDGESDCNRSVLLKGVKSARPETKLNGHSRARVFVKELGRFVVVESNCLVEGNEHECLNCGESPHLVMFEDIHGGETKIRCDELERSLDEQTDCDTELRRQLEELVRERMASSGKKTAVAMNVAQCSNVELVHFRGSSPLSRNMRKTIKSQLTSKFEYSVCPIEGATETNGVTATGSFSVAMFHTGIVCFLLVVFAFWREIEEALSHLH